MKKAFLIISFISICFFLSAEPSIYDIISEFPPDRVEDLLSGQTIKYYSINGQYVPGIAYDYTMGKSKATKDYNESDAFTLGLASFIEYPESWKELEYDEKKLNIINTLLSVSTIEGITYKSYTAGDKPKVLFSEAYTLVDKDSKKEAYDVEFSYAPEEYSYEIAAYLKDSIFGGNKYLIKYDISESEIFMTITNYSDLKFMFFKAMSKGELNMCVDVVMTEEGIALFALATVYGRDPVVKTPITEVDLPSAFMKRITSLKNWFFEEINK